MADVGGIIEAILKKYGITLPAAPAPAPAAPGLTPEDHKMLASFGAPAAPNLATVEKWDEIKRAIYEATSKGLGRWLSGPGDPRRLLNPFLSLSGPGSGQIYGPERTRGVGAL